MENIIKNNVSKFLLIGQINGLSWESKKNKKKLLETKVVEKQSLLSLNNNIIKSNIRYRLLAYAFLSGKSYIDVEKKCGKHNKPSASMILNIVKSLGTIWNPITKWIYSPSQEDIQKWLDSNMS